MLKSVNDPRKDMRDEFDEMGDIVNGTFSGRAPKIKLDPLRLLRRDLALSLLFKIFLFFAIVGGALVAISWKILGGILLVIAVLLAVLIWRFIGNRKTEFQNAVLSPGIVISESPPTVLILANMASDGEYGDAPIWGVKKEDSRSLEPFPNKIGQRIPCVTAFLGTRLEGSWDQMVSSPLTSGTGDRKKLEEALSRLDDEEEWRILEMAIQQNRIPEIGKTLRL